MIQNGQRFCKLVITVGDQYRVNASCREKRIIRLAVNNPNVVLVVKQCPDP
jgi:hypothetical protein